MPIKPVVQLAGAQPPVLAAVVGGGVLRLTASKSRNRITIVTPAKDQDGSVYQLAKSRLSFAT
jgi:hypothetical protein